MVQVGCREASGVREMQDTKQKGWVTPHHRSPRLACCKPGGRAIFFFFYPVGFLWRWWGRMGRKRTDCNFRAEGSWRAGKEQETTGEGTLQSTQSYQFSVDGHNKALQNTSSTAHTDSENQEGKEAWLHSHRMSRHQVPPLPVIF